MFDISSTTDPAQNEQQTVLSYLFSTDTFPHPSLIVEYRESIYGGDEDIKFGHEPAHGKNGAFGREWAKMLRSA